MIKLEDFNGYLIEGEIDAEYKSFPILIDGSVNNWVSLKQGKDWIELNFSQTKEIIKALQSLVKESKLIN